MNLLKEGLLEVDASIPIKYINPEKESIKYVIENAKPGSYITICSDVIAEALDLVMEYKEKDENFEFHKEEIPNVHNEELVR
jgi:cyanophycin synthetase